MVGGVAMMWIIASLPFWMLGIFFFVGIFASVTQRKPSESSKDIAIQMVCSMILSGVAFIVAAKIAS